MSPAPTNRSSIPGGRAPTGLVFGKTGDGPAVQAMAPRIPMSAKGFSESPTARDRAPSRPLLARRALANPPGGHDSEKDAAPAQDARRTRRDVEDERGEQADDAAGK